MKAVVFAKRSERFPEKHMKSTGGMTLIDMVVSEILKSEKIGEVIIYSRDSSVKSDLCRTIEDRSEGSLADSLLSALREFGDLFAFAGDMPCLSHRIMDEMIGISSGQTIVPEYPDGKIEPLHSIYIARYIDVLESNIRSDLRSLREFISRVPHRFYRILPEQKMNFFNVNREEDFSWFKTHGCGDLHLK